MSFENWRPKGIRQKVVPYIGSGLTQAEIARQLGCSRVAVHAALKQLKAPYVHKHDAAVAKYIGSGLTYREVAQRVGCAHSTVGDALRRLGASL